MQKFFFFCFLGLSLTAHALTVISDLDDTIKITRVKHAKVLLHGLFDERTFLGMDELVRAFKATSQNQVVVVSGSPGLIRSHIKELFDENNMVIDNLILVGGTPKKAPALKKLLSEIQDDVILLGDDQESDPIFYQELQTLFPQKVKAVYIHRLNIRDLPPGQIGYLTAYEVAIHEAHAGRLPLEAAEKVKIYIQEKLDTMPRSRVISNYFSEMLIPDWQNCTADSVEDVLALSRVLPAVDLAFLSRIEAIAVRNCERD